MTILVIGGTGMVGSHVVSELVARKTDVRVLTRSADKARDLPAAATAAIGDLLDPGTVRSVFDGVDGVFLLNPLSTTETHEGLMAVNGMHMAGVERVVYLSVYHADRAAYLPHFGAKIPVEGAIKASGMGYTILRPNSFFQNDYWLKDAIMGYGLYPHPLGEVGVSRVDVRDIAEAAAIALTTSGHEGQTYNVVGPEALTGPRSADIWSRALGRTITYGGDDLDAWEQQALQHSPPWMVFDLKLMFALFQRAGLEGTTAEIEQLTNLLGHPPRTFEAFVAETAQAWKA